MKEEEATSKPIHYEVPSWDHIYELLIGLSYKIKESGFVPDIIVGVSRGGWPPARVLSDLLDNPNLANVKVEFYLDIYKTAEEPKITQLVSMPVKNKRILVVDDVADSGKSLKLVREHLLEEGASEVRICSLYYKPWSIVVPDYYMKETTAWICFPWERREFISLQARKLKAQGKAPSEIEDWLVKIGLDRSIVKQLLPDVLEGT